MNNNTLYTLVGLALFAIFALFAMRLVPALDLMQQPEKYVSRGDIKGIDIVKNDVPYTLNLDQQSKVINFLNLSIPVGKTPFTPDPKFPFSKIVIHRVNGSAIELLPITYDSNDLIYSAPAWNPTGYMRDVSDGGLKKILSQTIDR